MLLLDLIASLLLTGRLRGARGAGAAAAVLLALALPGQGRAQSGDAFAIKATSAVVLAHVVTGDAAVDRLAQAGLVGLSDVLTQRTSVEPESPMAVNVETDELAFFPFLYWPVTADEPLPSQAAYAKLNEYLRTGGMILFDTRDADIAGSGATTPNSARLQQIAAGLDIPPLEPVPPDHVLTRSLLPDPGLPRPLHRRQAVGRGRAARGQEGRGHAIPQPQRRGDAGGDRRQRLGRGLGGR